MPPSTTTAAPMSLSQFESLPVYLALVSIVAQKCKTISSGESDLKLACDSLSDAVAKYRTVIEPLGSILPAANDLSNLDIPGLSFAQMSIIQPNLFKGIMQTFQRETGLYDTRLPGDSMHASYFSKESQQQRARWMEEGKYTADWGDLVRLAVVTLGQVRLARQESNQSGRQEKWLLIGSLLPQLLILSCISLQYMLLKKRELAARKRNNQINRDRQLLDQLMERRREAPIEMMS